MMIMSFFEAVDVLPYVQQTELIINGNEIVLTEQEQQDLMKEICEMFEDAHTMPAFGVVFDEMYKQEIQEGQFVKLKFPKVFEVNGLPFDELVFKVSPEYHGFNLMRGMNGVFQGRCIYIDLQDKTMADLDEYLNSLNCVKNIKDSVEEKIETENIQDLNQQEAKNIEMKDDMVDDNLNKN